jgi:phenylacetate-CoA ligase
VSRGHKGGWVLDRLRHAGIKRVFGEAFEEAKCLYWATQWSSEEAAREQQWEWVQAILRDAHGVSPFYQQRLEKAGWPRISPEGFRHIPPLTRQELEIRAREGRQRKSWRGLRRASGGSGGLAINIPINREIYSWYLAGTWRGILWWGTELGERAIVLLGGSHSSPLYTLPRVAKDWVMNWRRIPVDDLFESRVPQVLHDIETFGPAYLYGYPSAVHRLARTIRDQGRGPRHRLTVVVLTGEPLYSFQRRTIEDAFQCPVAEEYGSSELGCIAFQCPQGGLHVTVENVFLETSSNGLSGANHGGSILATQLRNRIFPLIRYDTGDVGVLNADPCMCGRGLPTLRLLGRAQDLVISRQGAIPAHLCVEQIFNLLPEHLLGRVRVSNDAPGEITLHVDRGIASRADLAHVTTLAADALGRDWHVRIAEVQRFRRLSSGKLPYFLRGNAQNESASRHE